MLEAKLAAVEQQMRALLAETRATFRQSTDKGSDTEAVLRDFLTKYLPLSYRVGHGEIIDTHGMTSRQTDIVIASEAHPLTFTADLPGLFFIEGVLAAGESKMRLTHSDLERSLEASTAFKKLRPLHSHGDQTSAAEGDVERFLNRRAWFLFCFESRMALDAIFNHVIKYQKAAGLTDLQLVDAIFVLDRGFLINYGDGTGSLRFTGKDGSIGTGWLKAEPANVLSDFLAWLSIVMPRIVSWRAILSRYLVPGQRTGMTPRE